MLEELIPSRWQRYTKSGSSFRYESRLRDVMRGRFQNEGVSP